MLAGMPPWPKYLAPQRMRTVMAEGDTARMIYRKAIVEVGAENERLRAENERLHKYYGNALDRKNREIIRLMQSCPAANVDADQAKQHADRVDDNDQHDSVDQNADKGRERL